MYNTFTQHNNMSSIAYYIKKIQLTSQIQSYNVIYKYGVA